MANEHLAPLWWPHASLRDAWETRDDNDPNVSTQPWVSALLYQLVRALDYRRVVELGCYRGVTSAWLACAVEANGGGTVTLVDIQAGVLKKTERRLAALALAKTQASYVEASSAAFLETQLPANTQFIFIDDDKLTVPAELERIKAVAPRALVAIHDAETIGAIPGALMLATPPLYGSGHLALVQC